jgi:hypothetical protein
MVDATISCAQLAPRFIRSRGINHLGARVGVLCYLAGLAKLFDHQVVRVFLDHTLEPFALVAGNDQETTSVIANSLIDRERDRKRRRAGAIGAFTEELDHAFTEFFAEPLEPLIHLPEDVLVQGPPFAVRHKDRTLAA